MLYIIIVQRKLLESPKQYCQWVDTSGPHLINHLRYQPQGSALHFPSREVLSRPRLMSLDWLRRRKSFLTSYYHKILSHFLYLILNHYKITYIPDIPPSHILIFCDLLFGFYFYLIIKSLVIFIFIFNQL